MSLPIKDPLTTLDCFFDNQYTRIFVEAKDEVVRIGLSSIRFLTLKTPKLDEMDCVERKEAEKLYNKIRHESDVIECDGLAVYNHDFVMRSRNGKGHKFNLTSISGSTPFNVGGEDSIWIKFRITSSIIL